MFTRWAVIPSGGHVLDDVRCMLCSKKPKKGQAVLWRDMAVTRVMLHKTCIIFALAQAPVEETEEVFDQLRQQIIEAGDIFVEA